jgi:hypothetical protein
LTADLLFKAVPLGILDTSWRAFRSWSAGFTDGFSGLALGASALLPEHVEQTSWLYVEMSQISSGKKQTHLYVSVYSH